MWTYKNLFYGADILLSAFAVYQLFCYFDIFFERKMNKGLSLLGSAVFLLWQLGISMIISFPAYVNIVVTIIVTFFSVMIAYEGVWWNKCLFVVAYNAIWMLMETMCYYILMISYEKYAFNQLTGSLISKLLFFIVILALRKVFTDDEIKELPARFSIMLILIAMGSIYIMNNIFMLGLTVNYDHSHVNSVITVIILLGMNVLIFYIYMKLADDLWLRRMTSAYEQQLDLCERHQQERELSMLQLRDVKHNMKNNLVSILAYAEERDCENIISFVNEIMGEIGMTATAVSNSGNIVIDSLLGYWFVTAQKMNIDFSIDICIPVKMPFTGADLSLILGNLLENAVEAASKTEGKKYIKVRMKFDKNNLLLFVVNSYKGRLIKTKEQRLKSTKPDAGCHGVGLPSVYRAAAKYHGTVVIDDTVPERFGIRVLLYGNQE